MANNISLAERYLALLDEVYAASAKSAILDSQDVQFVGGNTVKIFKMTMDGLGNYNRSTGYLTGDVTGSWETLSLAYDRGRSFTVDEMDDEETAGLAFGRLAGEFIRVKTAPELDAYTFAKMASWSGIDSATPADITIGTTRVDRAIEAASASMDANEVPDTGRLLFISEEAYRGLCANVTRYLANDRNVNTNIEEFNQMQIIRVPQNRFNTKITLNDGATDGQTVGGYVIPADTSYKINFMIVHPSAVLKTTKHVLPRFFAPRDGMGYPVNPNANGWKFDYRIYGDTFVQENKVKGIYLHRKNTANA